MLCPQPPLLEVSLSWGSRAQPGGHPKVLTPPEEGLLLSPRTSLSPPGPPWHRPQQELLILIFILTQPRSHSSWALSWAPQRVPVPPPRAAP